MQATHYTIQLSTPGRGLYSIHREVASWVQKQVAKNGLLTVIIQHTSASLLIQENADPDVRTDLDNFFSRLVKDGDNLFIHTAEGPDDMPAHVRAALTQTQLSIPIIEGKMALGTWQGLYLFEHRHRPHQRKVLLHLLHTNH